MPMKGEKKKLLMYLMWLLEGIIVGFGAILPGISGGTLCVAFGMYRPIIDTISNLRAGLKKYGWMLVTFVAGIGAGFVGLSGLAAVLLERNTALVTCAFIGFIVGTFPELWQDAGAQGRKKGDVIAMLIAFVAMVAVLGLLKTNLSISIAPGLPGFLLCGVLWGLSFIVPGLSSSSLLLFFGLYQPMLAGIAGFDFAVLIPLGLGMAACVLLLSKAVDRFFKRRYAVASHCILGIVAATAVMILPEWSSSAGEIVAGVVAIVGGAALSYLFSRLCQRIQGEAK